MNPLVPVAGALALFYVLTRKPAVQPEPAPSPSPLPTPPAPAPTPAPPGPNPFPSTESTASIGAPNGLWLHGAPDVSSPRLELLPFNSFVAIQDSNVLPPTDGAPVGWFFVRAPSGKAGYASAEWVVFGTDKERGMTPEEETAYHQHMAEREDPIFQGARFAPRTGAGLSWAGVSRSARTPTRPAILLVTTRLRTAPNAANAVATVGAGEVVQVVRRSGGWVLARYRDRHARNSPVFTGWLPANVLRV